MGQNQNKGYLNESVAGMQKHRESIQAGVRQSFNPNVGGDDGFIRRSSFNEANKKAALMADAVPPPVVDINEYVPPKMSTDDIFFGQTKICKEHINRNPYANVPPPPPVDINDYVPPKAGGDDSIINFVGRRSLNADQIKAAMAIPAPPAVDINEYVPPKMSTDDVFFNQTKWSRASITSNPLASAEAPPVANENYGNYVRRTSGVITLPVLPPQVK